MKKFLSAILSLCLMLQLFCVGAGAVSADQFKDLKNHWAKGYIDILCQRNIINGYSNGTFAPNKSLTKAEAAKLICLSAEIQPSSTVDTNLTDINMHWAKKYIAVLPETPNKNGQFQPNTQITRAEFAQMVVGAMYVDTVSTDTSALRKRFKDWASIPSESAEFVAVAIEKGIINGYEDSTFRPNATLTRAEACTMLKRAFYPDVKLTPSHYYTDTVAYANNVTQMVCAADESLYYVADNQVFRAGQNAAVFRAEDISYTASADEILDQSDIKHANGGRIISISDCAERIKESGSVYFDNFTLAGVAADNNSNDVYAIVWSKLENYSFVDNLYMVAAYDVSAPDKPLSVFFDSGTSDTEAALPNGEIVLKSGDYIYYATGYDSVRQSSWSPEILRWDVANTHITSLYDGYLKSGIYSIGVFNNSIWCMAGDSDATLWNINTNQSYDLDDVGFAPAGAWKNNFYFWNSKESALYCATIPTSGSGNLSFRRLVNSQDILSNDGYSLGRYDYQDYSLWAANSDTIYFYRDSANEIRRIYGK